MWQHIKTVYKVNKMWNFASVTKFYENSNIGCKVL